MPAGGFGIIHSQSTQLPNSAAPVSLSQTTYIYDGKAKKPLATVVADGETVPASGFDVNYASNTNAGTATVTVTQAQGAVAYANASMDAAAKKLKVDAKTGKVTVKKGTKAGKYTIKIKVTAAGNVNCKSGSKNVACKVEVK